MNIDETIVRHCTLTNGTAGLVISLITCSETAVPIRTSISLFFPDCMFGEDRSRLTVGCETSCLPAVHVTLFDDRCILYVSAWRVAQYIQLK